MAIFTNQASLTYNGNTIVSNIVSGEILEVLSMTKTAVTPTYNPDDTVTYVITLRNSGTTPITGLTVTDDLGAYQTATVPPDTLVPLNYNPDTILYYNGADLMPTPTVTGTNPLTITGINVPANGNSAIVYQATVNGFAPPTTGGTVTNTIEATGAGLTQPVRAAGVITAADEPNLTINKAVSPATVSENGTLTYTFTINNAGNTAATAADNISIIDVFTPILDPITVTLDGVALTENTDYTYDRTTGRFATIPGRITVNEAQFSQTTPSGEFVVTPGTSTLVVSGTV